MARGFFNVPVAVNEPVKVYAPGSPEREELLATGKVTYTKHTAFAHGFSYENNQEYFSELEEHIMDCLSNMVTNPLLSRSERVTF